MSVSDLLFKKFKKLNYQIPFIFNYHNVFIIKYFCSNYGECGASTNFKQLENFNLVF